MGGGKSSKAPKAPDYAALSAQDAKSNMDIAKYLTEANRVNQVGPQGSVTWSQAPNPATAQATSEAQKNADYWNSFVSGNGWAGDPAARTPEAVEAARNNELVKANDWLSYATKGGGASGSTPDGGPWTQTTTLSPEQQALYDTQSQGYLSSMQNVLGQGSFANNSAQQFAPNLSNQIAAEDLFKFHQSPNMQQLGLLNEDSGQYQAQGDKIRDSLYQQLTRFSDERFGNQENTERNRLAQMGLQEGTEAYKNAMSEFNRSKNESYENAGLQATLAGGGEQSRILNDLLGTRSSNMGLLNNQYNQQQQTLNSGIQLADLASRNRNQQYAEQLSSHQQGISQDQYARQSAQQLMAMMQGGGAAMPNYGNYNAATGWQGTDLTGAAQATYNSKMGAANAGQQQKSGLLGAGSSLLGSFMGGK